MIFMCIFIGIRLMAAEKNINAPIYRTSYAVGKIPMNFCHPEEMKNLNLHAEFNDAFQKATTVNEREEQIIFKEPIFENNVCILAYGKKGNDATYTCFFFKKDTSYFSIMYARGSRTTFGKHLQLTRIYEDDSEEFLLVKVIDNFFNPNSTAIYNEEEKKTFTSIVFCTYNCYGVVQAQLFRDPRFDERFFSEELKKTPLEICHFMSIQQGVVKKMEKLCSCGKAQNNFEQLFSKESTLPIKENKNILKKFTDLSNKVKMLMIVGTGIILIESIIIMYFLIQ
ncbi:MAG TPA: hypothetical protein VL201_03075 [Patescibacteria group bacterium]|nr:hypothetical protein [Patescibacteria group bacterium]